MMHVPAVEAAVSAAKICKGRRIYRATLATVLSKRRLEVFGNGDRGSGRHAREAPKGLPRFETRSLPRSLAPTLVTLPSMSLIPFAPFSGDVGSGL
jgi:hypothetical protein